MSISKSTKRSARFIINQTDDDDNNQYRILAIILSAVPAEYRFGRGSGNLDSRLDDVLKNEANPIIKENFHFNRYGNSEQIHDLLSAHVNYGRLIGLRNSGPDFNYEVTTRTHEVAREIADLNLIPESDRVYLASLGSKLIQ